MGITKKSIENTISKISAKFPKGAAIRIKTGVNQVAELWNSEDGDSKEFGAFCLENFYTGKDLDTLFDRFESKLELLGGHFNSLQVALRQEMDEARGEMKPFDLQFASFSPDNHVVEDMFKNKLAFLLLLNFEINSFDEIRKKGHRWNRRKWSETRLTSGFATRVPPEVERVISDAYTRADSYINNYNIYMGYLEDNKGKRLFDKNLCLISHWGLRDEIKSLYSDPKANLPKQKMIQTVMERIIKQEIPRDVINKKVVWNPVKNVVKGKESKPEPDTRYEKMLDLCRAHKGEDKYYKNAPTHMDRKFKNTREIPEEEMEALLVGVLKAPVGKKVGALIKERLGRELLPLDIWYDGFKSRGSFGEEKLNAIVKRKFPKVESFEKKIPDTLQKLGFDKKTAKFLGERIVVDPARGAGHAWGPQMRTEKAHLRTRIPESGIDYKGFNIAMHELGHCVEQVFSLYRVDHTLLSGVPNTAFTEGFAFVFQDKDLKILGLDKPDRKKAALKALDTFWAVREIGAVSLVDMRAWRWMYKHPKATPEQLKRAVIKVAKDVWNEYFAEVFGVKNSPLLGVYSHMIDCALYLPDYPLGHVIAYQIEDYFKKKSLPREMERMCKLGCISPNEWMKEAIGAGISSTPMVNDAKKALSII